MATDYFDTTGLPVVSGTTATAADINEIITEANDAFDLVDVDITALTSEHRTATSTTLQLYAAAANSGANILLNSDGDVEINPVAGSAVVLDGTISVDAGIITGATSITSTAFVGALTGNCSGTAATVTGATQAAITTCANLVTVGALNSGSITSGFGTINIGTSALTCGALTSTGIDDNAASTAITIDSSGNAGIGGSTIIPINTDSRTLLLESASGSELQLKNSGGLSADELVGGIAFGHDDPTSGAGPHYSGIQARSIDTSGTMKMEFYTGLTSYESRTNPVLTLDQTGNIFGTTGTTTMTDGFVHIPAAGGAATGVPTVTTNTLAPLYFDTTNNRLYIYDNVDNTWHYISITA